MFIMTQVGVYNPVFPWASNRLNHVNIICRYNKREDHKQRVYSGSPLYNVVSNTYTSRFVTNSTSYAEVTGLTTSITPSSHQ